MSEVQVNKVCLVLCDECGQVVEAQWRKGFIGIRKGWHVRGNECPHCHKKLQAKHVATIMCPHCQKLVQESEDGTCINCHKKIYTAHETFTATCPECGVTNIVLKKHTGTVRCTACDSILPNALVEQYLKMESTEPQSIALPTAQQMTVKKTERGESANVIWKHPQNTFPFKSRVIVSEGTYALLFQNGSCDYPLGPGSYLLEEMDLTQTQKFDEALSRDDIVFRTDLFCVAKHLGTHHLGAGNQASTLQSANGLRTYTVAGNADLTLTVSDARAFAEFVNYREIGQDELLHMKRDPSDTHPAGLLIAPLRDAFGSAVFESVQELIKTRGLNPADLTPHHAELQKLVVEKINTHLDPIGVRVESMSGADFTSSETEASAAATALNTIRAANLAAITRAAKDQFEWKTESFQIMIGGKHELSASLSLSGRAMMKADAEYFLQTAAIEKLLASPTLIQPENVVSVVRGLFEQTLSTHAQAVVQRMVLEGTPEDIRDLNLYLADLGQRLQAAMTPSLRLSGLDIYSLIVSPLAPQLSHELEAYYSLEKKQKQIQQYVETMFDWFVRDIPVHVKDHTEYSASVSYSGSCRFRILDRDRYFALSEAEQFVQKTPPATLQDVQTYYKDLIGSQYGQYLQVATQQFIDAFDPDIRYLNSLTDRMINYVTQQLDPLVTAWGLRIESMTIRPVVSIAPGSVLETNLHVLEGKARRAIDLDEHKDINQNTVEIHRNDAETAVELGAIDVNAEQKLTEQKKTSIKIQSSLADAETDEEIARRQREERIRVYEYDLKRAAADRNKEATKSDLQGEAEIKELRDRMAADQKTRDFDALFEEFRRRRQLDEAKINKELDEDDLRQNRKIQSQIAWIEGQQKMEDMDAEHRQQLEERQKEHERTIAGIQHASGLDKAGFDKALNGILHEIDAADLDWRRKLEEYNRLAHQMNFQDQLSERKETADQAREEKLADAQAAAQIAGMKVDADAKAHHEQIDHQRAQDQLAQEVSTAQADLAERIARWAEERTERQDTGAYNRQERRDILLFEQQMRDRRELAAQKLEELNAQYEHEQAQWKHEQEKQAMTAEIEKLKLQLDYMKARDEKQYSAEEARVRAEQAAKEAEAKYRTEHEEKDRQAERERLEAQQKRGDSLMDKAVELYKTLSEMEQVLAVKRLDVHMHDSDNQVAMHGQDAQTASAIASQNKVTEQLQGSLNDLKTAIENKNGEKIDRSFDLLLDNLRDLRRTIEMGQTSAKGGQTGHGNETGDLVKGLNKVTSSIREMQNRISKELTSIEKTINARRCPQCGSIMEGRFCSNCGYPGKTSQKNASIDPFAASSGVCIKCGRGLINGKCPVCDA